MSKIDNSSAQSWLYRSSSVLWVVWGLVHMLAGIMTMTRDTPGAIQGIADAVDPATLEMAYPAAAGAILNQHGFNLFWIGLVTVLCAVYVWRGSFTAVWLAALVGGLADLGYFLFLDLGGFVKFIPGTLMTLVSATAILASFWAHFSSRTADKS